MLCTKILFGADEVDMAEWRFFLAGPSGAADEKDNPTDWLDPLEWSQVWLQLFYMDKLPAFKGIANYFVSFHKKFKKIFDSLDPHEEPLPGEWNTKLNSFQKMIVLKAIRADKITLAVQNFVIEKIGKQYVEPPTFNLGACFDDSSNVTPLVFVLSTGSDPVAGFRRFCEEKDMLSRSDLISLGQGQAPKAEKMIADGIVKGTWVLLQNCHLSLTWMPKLEALVETLSEGNHTDFRLWLTSMPNPKFPVSILQNSVKMTQEPPSGLRSNLLQTYSLLDNRALNDSKKPEPFKKLLFAFSFFHAIVQERVKYGPIGWNIPYAFTNEDADVCKRQLKIFIDEYDELPYRVLNYLGASINYGGRVTDDKDIRLINSILRQYVCPEILKDDHPLSASGKYRSIPAGSQDDYITYIKSFDLNVKPEAFGLHENAEIVTNQSGTRVLIENVLSIQPRSSSGGGVSREETISLKCSDL